MSSALASTYLTSLLARRVSCSFASTLTAPTLSPKAFNAMRVTSGSSAGAYITVQGRCKFCGASQKALDRGEELETHAYAFIHTDEVKTVA